MSGEARGNFNTPQPPVYTMGRHGRLAEAGVTPVR